MRHAIVTGASSGIGEAIVSRLLAQGWQVTGLSRRHILRDHPAFASLSVDISDTEALLGALQELPVPQAVIHAAGMMAAAPLGNLDHGVSNALWSLHVQACEVLFNHFAPECQQAVGLSPLAAGHPAARLAAHSMSPPKRRWSEWSKAGRQNLRLAALPPMWWHRARRKPRC
jgi:NAD(P)-dependent dehydrogenase (short-subunit alcohol dehydrogenase family)